MFLTLSTCGGKKEIRWRRSFGGTGPVIGPKLLALEEPTKDYTPACPEGSKQTKRFCVSSFKHIYIYTSVCFVCVIYYVIQIQKKKKMKIKFASDSRGETYIDPKQVPKFSFPPRVYIR